MISREVDLTIRRFDESDRAEVIALWNACGLVYPQNDPNKDIDRKLGAGAELFLVAVDKSNTPVASAMGGYDGHRGWVNYLAVSPLFRGRGVGSKIMAALEAQLRDLGCAKINLQI